MDAYAVIETGGKQYRVAKGSVVSVEKLGTAKGGEVTFDRVLAVSDGTTLKVGTPAVPGAKVVAAVIEEGRGPKVVAFKKKRRKGYRRKVGHRQEFTTLRVGEIGVG